MMFAAAASSDADALIDAGDCLPSDAKPAWPRSTVLLAYLPTVTISFIPNIDGIS